MDGENGMYCHIWQTDSRRDDLASRRLSPQQQLAVLRPHSFCPVRRPAPADKARVFDWQIAPAAVHTWLVSFLF